MAEQFVWRWCGHEIFGNRHISNSDIEAFFPIELGKVVDEEEIKRIMNCNDTFSRSYEAAFAGTGILRQIIDGDGKAFAITDIVEYSDLERLRYRCIISNGRVEFQNEEASNVYDTLKQEHDRIFSEGKAILEFYDRGYKSYELEELDKHARTLSELCPAMTGNLLEILATDKDILRRGKAADMLCWTRNNHADTIMKAAFALDDPASLVRNNVSRFFIEWINQVTDIAQRRELITTLGRQLTRPSFGDRNKALYCIAMLVRTASAQERKTWRPLVRTSILDILNRACTVNIVEPAQEIKKLLGIRRRN